MEQYISKSALLAEIERLVNNYDKALDYEAALEDVRDFLDSIEVKEVDLEKHLKEDIEDVLFDLNGVAVKGATYYLTVEDVKDIARHFFELGLKASQPTTPVYGIEEALKENGIDPDSKEADMYREVIYKIYDRLKALKGE